MNLVIPMAGMGKRMRPHTLTVPKPLIPVAGKTIVRRLVEEITSSCKEKINEIAFVTGHFGAQTEAHLLEVAKSVGARGSIFHQEEALGIAHAILCAKEALHGKVMVAFADTLFKGNFSIDLTVDGTIWVQKISDPSQFGVVKVDKQNIVTGFVEKPQQFVSDLAIIGVYYFSDGKVLRYEIEQVIEKNIKDRGEYQLTTVLQQMKNNGIKFNTARVKEWLDCGNKDATVYSNQRILENDGKNILSSTVILQNSVIIPPCYIGENVALVNSIVGPYVSVGDNTLIEDSRVKNSIIQNHTKISCLNIHNSMLGNYVDIKYRHVELNIGDYTSHLQKE